MSRWFYQIVLWFVRPLVHLRLRYRARKDPAYGERKAERFGFLPAGLGQGVVWFHTVSAGETIAAAPLIRQLADEFVKQPFLVTTMTPTGSEQVQARLSDKVQHCYAPYDFPDALDRFFTDVKPVVLILMETELWPNMVAMAAERSIPVLLINGRLVGALGAWLCQTEPIDQTHVWTVGLSRLSIQGAS